jgi:ABC-type multidrug transport system permease subunit
MTEIDDTACVLRRIKRNSVAAYIAFAIFTLNWAGFRAFLGLTCAAAVTMISFLWLEDVIGVLLQPSPQLRAWRVMLRAVLRLLLLGVAILVMIFVARFNVVSVLLGFSIVVVGIIGEAFYATYQSFTV